MLTLNEDSACDVCAEEYGPFNLPRCIPCGHVLCATCADTIIAKAPSRQSPLCPFCREGFTREGVRVIRIDFSGSSGGGVASASGTGFGGRGDGLGDTETCIDGGAYAPGLMSSGPSFSALDDEMVLYDVRRARSPPGSSRTSRDPSRATSPERHNGIFAMINEDHPSVPTNFDVNAHKERSRELEKRVAKVATKRCSVEEVQALQRELGDWLSVDKILGSSGLSTIDKQQYAAIQLSYHLLRAILMNHAAHSESSRVSKGAEAQLRARIADGELVREKLDEDLRKTKKELAGRMQEVMNLRAELARLRGEDPSHVHAEYRAVTPTRRQSLSAPTSPDGYFGSFGFSSTSSASTAVPPSSSRSNPSSGTNSPCSSGRTTPTAGLALGGSTSMMPMGGGVAYAPTIGMTLSSAGIGPGSERRDGFNGTSGGMSSASAAANSASSASAAAQRMFTISTPPRAQSTAPTSTSSPLRTGVSSASSATPTPTRPQSTVPARSQTPGNAGASSRYGHMRSASMIHRSATVVPGLSSASSASAAASASHTTTTSTSQMTSGRDRRSTTPAPIHQRSASVAPGAVSSASAAAAAGRTLTRSMTPNLSSASRAAASGKESGGLGNGYSAGGTSHAHGHGHGGLGLSSASGHVPPVPALPSLSNGTSSSHSSSGLSGLSRPPVPPKPRTLSQSPSSQTRGVVDDRDGYATEKESSSPKREKDREKKERGIRHVHERWLPSALVDRMTRPATSHG